MTKAFPHIALCGDTFSPAKAEHLTGLRFSQKHEPGQIATWGRFKGKPYPFGAATLVSPKGLSASQALAWLLDAVEPHVETLKQLGADDNAFHITYAYESQCNLEFEPNLLARLAQPGFRLTITCYQSDSEFVNLEGEK